MEYKIESKSCGKKNINQGLAGMCWWGDHQIIISDRDQLIYYDVLLDSIVNKHYVYGPVNKERLWKICSYLMLTPIPFFGLVPMGMGWFLKVLNSGNLNGSIVEMNDLT